MSKSAFSFISIVLLVVGLISGGAGAYLFTNSSLQPKIDDLNKQTLNLGVQVTTQNTKISQLNSTVASLQTENAKYVSQVQTLQTENAQQKTDIAKLNSDLAAKNATILAQDVKILELEAKLRELKGTFNTTPGFIGHYMYGFSFEYPQNMTISIGGLLNNVADDESGKVAGQNEDQAFTIVYQHTVTVPDLDAAIDGAFSVLASQGTVVRGTKVTSQVQGHVMKYQNGTATITGYTFSVVYSYWHCPKTQRFFGFSYATLTNQETMSGFQHFIDTVKCHFEDTI